MSIQAEGASQDASLSAHEMWRDGRTVLRLRTYASPNGFTVLSEVYPASQPPGTPPVQRPFAFATIDQARRFTDEALTAFEYLNCTTTPPEPPL